jgi:hypothetical protein
MRVSDRNVQLILCITDQCLSWRYSVVAITTDSDLLYVLLEFPLTQVRTLVAPFFGLIVTWQFSAPVKDPNLAYTVSTT